MAETAIFHKMGFRMPVPEAFAHTKGMMSPMEIGDKGDGTYFMMCTYIATTAEELKAAGTKSENGELGEEAIQKAADAMGVLLVIVGIGGGQGPKEIREKLGMGYVTDDCFTEVGRYKDITYYAVFDPESEEKYVAAQAPEFAEEFRALQAAWLEALKNAEYTGPQIPGADLVGKTVHFETTDIDGNPVKSEDIFAAHAVTMVNFWATWCGPCRKELKELGNIHRRLETKDAAIIGVCDDAADKADECRELIKENNLSYLNLLPYEGMEELEVQDLPTSFFVDRQGKILTCPMTGVPEDISEYEKMIDSLLNGEDPAPVSSAAADSENKKEYRVVVKDETGAPVAGARVQFCDDTTCMFAKTDAEGTASFSAVPGQYTVHIQSAPEGYEPDPKETAAAADAQEVQIILKRA